MTTPIPPDTRAAGQPGHIADHNQISDALTSLANAVGSLQSLSPVPASEVGAASGVASLDANGLIPAAQLLAKVTPAAGYTLANAAGTILSWTAPADGALHRVTVRATLHVTSPETGGLVSVTYTLPDGTVQTGVALFAAGQGSGVYLATVTYHVKAGTVFTLQQGSALSPGAAVLWADLQAL